MTDKQQDSRARPRVTTKDTIATYKLADMHRVFQIIEDDDLLALDKLMLSGRAFHLAQGIEVHVMDTKYESEGVCKLRVKGSITEIWASMSAL